MRILMLVILCHLAKFGYSQQSPNIRHDSLLSINYLYNKANILAATNSDSAHILFLKCKAFYTQELDTLGIIQILIDLSDLEKTKENYSQSYDYLWEALSLAENINSDLQLYNIHSRLGMLYSIFEKEQESLSHKLIALKLCKYLIKKEALDEHALLSSYFSIALYHRKTSNYELALSYFDSCQVVDRSLNQGELNNGFIKAELGYIKMVQGDYSNAEILLAEAIVQFIADDEHYLVFAYAYSAELKEKQNLDQEATINYQKCLQTMDRLNAHVDLRPDILDRLSKLYQAQNNYAKAYTHLRESKSINDSLFNVKGSSSQLFNMRNKYNEAIDHKNEQLKANELLLSKKSQSNLRLRILIFMLLLILTIIGFVMFYFFQKKKYLHEKREIALKNAHEKARAKEILDVKNKELTAYTLQLIDKDRIVNELYQYIQKNTPDGELINHVKSSITGNNKKMWDEFNLRFVAVNSNFYAMLRERFPKLTPTERKYCALIKLKFSSKDMAQLLQITVESVHISRHRLRKKMNLPREASLSNFIAEI